VEGCSRINKLQSDQEHHQYRKCQDHLMTYRVKCKEYSEICFFGKTLLAGSGNSSQTSYRRALQALLFLLIHLSKRLSDFPAASLYLPLVAVNIPNISISVA